MNTCVLDPQRDAQLRSLDAASDVTGDPARRNATLTAILATPVPTRDPNVRTLTPSNRPAPRRVRRWAALGAAAAAVVTGAAIVLPTITAAPSYASWTARADVVTDADAALLREACLAQQGSSVGEGQVSTADLPITLAERRGDWVTVLLSRRDADRMEVSVLCHASLPSGGDDVEHLESGATSGGGLPAPTGREFTQGSIFEFGGDHPAAVTDGQVGPDVAGLTLRADGHDIVATIKDGNYTAWWPGRAFAGGSSGESEPAITYDVTYADGTVERNVAPASPTGGAGESGESGESVSTSD